METNYKAFVKQDGDWWVGWAEEIPGVNSQGRTPAELMDNLASALQEAIQMNRDYALAAAGSEILDPKLSKPSGVE